MLSNVGNFLFTILIMTKVSQKVKVNLKNRYFHFHFYKWNLCFSSPEFFPFLMQLVHLVTSFWIPSWMKLGVSCHFCDRFTWKSVGLVIFLLIEKKWKSFGDKLVLYDGWFITSKPRSWRQNLVLLAVRCPQARSQDHTVWKFTTSFGWLKMLNRGFYVQVTF